ncbi:MAG: Outer membrane protein TolC precursor [Deltaproteobacteria bacterium ADurb.BinA179]|nr:TolC family protein [Pseudomonadota bacterium]NLW66498.1 TolC family protein [Bacteriovoracaceae bacterium]OPZ24756.1 MAG: Outer membrane protein TolC precursor [Deltaproteobacteria bacterium ADurb.BinA179]HNR51442.1 TolC family protein [Deltaproteobacteria bacterium]HRT45426.1 TolC family protein [Desulfomonilia bacterium]
MIRRMIVTVAGILFLGWSGSYAQDPMSLEDSIAAALNNNPLIKAQDEQVYESLMEKRSSFSDMLFSVDLNYSYARFDEEPTITIPPNEFVVGTKDNYAFSVEVVQPLFAGGALFNAYRIAANNFEVAGLDRQQEIRDLKLRVIETYYRIIEAREILEVARSSASSIKAHQDVANAFYNQGMIPKNDLLEAQVRYAESLQNVISAENAVRLLEAQLNTLLGRSISSAVNIEEQIPMPEMEASLEELYETALEHRQEIRITRLQIDNAGKGVWIARSGYLPNIAATYEYEKLGEDPDVDEDKAWTVGVGLRWRIFQGGSSYFDVSRAKAARNRLGYLMQALKDQVLLEVKNSFLSAQEAKARTEVAAKAIDQARENLRIQKDRYNLQVATTTNVLDAEALLDQARRNLISARADYATSMASLRSAMGTL